MGVEMQQNFLENYRGVNIELCASDEETFYIGEHIRKNCIVWSRSAYSIERIKELIDEYLDHK
jgi:hypothetical protein